MTNGTVAPKGRHDKDKALINERIRFDKMQLITAEGENRGLVTREVALQAAREAGLDLVLIAEKGKDGLPVAKIVDYGKMLYAKKKQQAEAKKKQHVVDVKELKLRIKIGEHDLQTKLNQALGFLHDGKRVKFTLIFRGREATMKNVYGNALFDKVHQFLDSEFGANLICEKDSSHTDMIWSRVYYLKGKG